MRKFIVFLLFLLIINSSSLYCDEESWLIFDDILNNPFELFQETDFAINTKFDLVQKEESYTVSFCDNGFITDDTVFYIFSTDEYELFFNKTNFKFTDDTLSCSKDEINTNKIIVLRDVKIISSHYQTHNEDILFFYTQKNWTEIRTPVSGYLQVFDSEPFAGINYNFVLTTDFYEIWMFGPPNLEPVIRDSNVNKNDIIGIFEGDRNKYPGKAMQLFFYDRNFYDEIHPVVVYYIEK